MSHRGFRISALEQGTASWEVLPLRQALWDVYGILGHDQDGDPDPGGVVDLIGVVVRAAEDSRRDYDEALDEIP